MSSNQAAMSPQGLSFVGGLGWSMRSGATGNGACLEIMVGSQAPGWEWGAGLREGQSPAVLHQVLHDLV